MGLILFLNKRKKPEELLYYEALSKRSILSKDEKYKCDNLQKGYLGECEYDEIIKKVGHKNLLIYRDVYLRVDETVSQYDAIIINDEKIVVNEVKNFSGDFVYKNNNWFKSSYQLSEDPIIQTKRSANKIISILKGKPLSILVDNKVIFINDEFYLESDDERLWSHICIRSNFNRYFRTLNQGQVGRKAEIYRDSIERCIVENPYFKPAIKLERLKLGFYCSVCGNFDLIKYRFHFKCEKCNSIESTSSHILRAINDFKFLFFGQPMTKSKLLKLVDYQVSPKVMQNALRKFCNFDRQSVMTHYTFNFFSYDDALEFYKDKFRYKNHYPK